MRYHARDRITSFPDSAEVCVDVCIIGGGATGAGCALDAQLRGLSTVLVEGADFASGASSASTKMAHGGVRYLQEAVSSLDIHQYRLVDHALHERVSMLHNAPYLTRPLEFLIPCLSRRQQLYYGTGVKAYDWIAGAGGFPPSRFLSRQEALARFPALNAERLTAAVTYSDGQFDDARYNVALIGSFVKAGGAAINYARVTGFERGADGKLAAALVEDRVSGESFRVQARVFVNATGPYSDGVRRMASPSVAPRMRPSKGVHILFPLEGFPDDTALLVPKTEDGRVIFAIPWQGRLLVGTTDDAASVNDAMTVSRAEIDYLLRQLNPYLARPLRAEEVVSAFAGIRPLVGSPNAKDTKTLIRDDEVEVDEASGLVSILGGKWTTYRLMAERTINRVEQQMGRAARASTTREYLLTGSRGYADDYWMNLTPQVPEGTARHLASKYGTGAADVVALIAEDSSLALPLVDGLPQIRAQVVYAARHEMALTVGDVLARRIGLQLFGWREAAEAAGVTAELLGRELGWPGAKVERDAADYRAMLK